MEQSEIMQTITGLVKEFFENYTGPVTRETSAADIEDWDSLAHIQLMVLIEQQTGVRFSTDEISEVSNLGALADIIEKKSN